MLEVYMTNNNFPNHKKPYVFRSRNQTIYTQKELVKMIADYNSTVTETDAIAVMKAFEEVFNRIIARGDGVKLFMGTFRAGASGTAESAEEFFSPKPKVDKRTAKHDHKISLIFEPAASYAKDLLLIPFKWLGLEKLCYTRISSVKNVLRENCDYFYPSDVIEIKGTFIKVRPKYNEEGVFLLNNKTHEKYRLNQYFRATRVTIAAFLPADIPSGEYSLFIETEKGTSVNSIVIEIKKALSN